jgi:hypothetical protein
MKCRFNYADRKKQRCYSREPYRLSQDQWPEPLAAEFISYEHWRIGMVTVEAINQHHVVPCPAQRRSHGQQTEGLDPHVVGRKVIDPWVDAQNSRHLPKTKVTSRVVRTAVYR